MICKFSSLLHMGMVQQHCLLFSNNKFSAFSSQKGLQSSSPHSFEASEDIIHEFQKKTFLTNQNKINEEWHILWFQKPKILKEKVLVTKKLPVLCIQDCKYKVFINSNQNTFVDFNTPYISRRWNFRIRMTNGRLILFFQIVKILQNKPSRSLMNIHFHIIFLTHWNIRRWWPQYRHSNQNCLWLCSLANMCFPLFHIFEFAVFLVLYLWRSTTEHKIINVRISIIHLRLW